jgi:hypothetical protein
MLTFKQFLEEKTEVFIDIKSDSGWLKRVPEINKDLANVLAKPFQNSAVFVNAARGTLERYGILLPAFQAVQQLAMELDVMYALGNSGYYVHIVHNLDCNGFVDGHCKILTQAEKNELEPEELIPDEEEGCCDKENPVDAINRMRRQVRRTNDDSGNDDEY